MKKEKTELEAEAQEHKEFEEELALFKHNIENQG